MDDLLRLFDAARENGSSLTFPVVLWALIFGIILSWIIVFYNKKVIGALVRAILSAEAKDEQSAKTLAELGQENNISAVSHLRHSESLRHIVHFVGEPEMSNVGKKKKPHVSFDENTRFYIPEASVYRASKKYDGSGSEIWKMLVGAVALFVLGIILTYFSL